MPRTAFVRVVEPNVHLIKENISGDPAEEYERIHVHGFDELGDPTMPVFEVPYCQPVTHAIHEEKIMAFDDKTGKPYEKYSGRLVEVPSDVVDQFPRWIGHPDQGMSTEQVVNTILKIRKEQKKGDLILGRNRKPYRLDSSLFPNDAQGKLEYAKAIKLLDAGEMLEIPAEPIPLKVLNGPNT